MDLIEKNLVDYIDQVDSASPAPGGGSVASLVGALGVALAKMSAHLSVKKNKFKEASKLKQNKYILAFKELDYYKDLLIRGIDDDALSYNAVVAAYKTKDEEKIQQALKTSAFIAYQMQDAAYNALKYANKLIELGNKNLYSDLISSAILLSSCVEMASLNVKANANGLTNDEEKEYYLVESAKLIKKSHTLKNHLINTINKQ